MFLDESFLFLPGQERGFDRLTRVGDPDRMGLRPFREGEVDGILRNAQIMLLGKFSKNLEYTRKSVAYHELIS